MACHGYPALFLGKIVDFSLRHSSLLQARADLCGWPVGTGGVFERFIGLFSDQCYDEPGTVQLVRIPKHNS